MTLGGLLGLVGESLSRWSVMLGQGLAMSIGISLILVALSKIFMQALPRLWLVNTCIEGLMRKAVAWKKSIAEPLQDLGLGGLTVFLPCMTLSPALAFAAGCQSPSKGALLMLAFFIGTLPSMLGLGLIPQKKLALFRLPKVLTQVAYVFLCMAGVITIARIFH